MLQEEVSLSSLSISAEALSAESSDASSEKTESLDSAELPSVLSQAFKSKSKATRITAKAATPPIIYKSLI